MIGLDLVTISLLTIASVADEATTVIACGKYGSKHEQNVWRRNLMDKFGVFKSIPLQFTFSNLGYYGLIWGSYLFESAFGGSGGHDLYEFTSDIMPLAPAYCASTNVLQILHKKKLDSKTL